MNLTTVRFYLTAKTKDELIVKQIENNTLRGTWFDYSPPQKVGSDWITWYFDDAMKRINK